MRKKNYIMHKIFKIIINVPVFNNNNRFNLCLSRTLFWNTLQLWYNRQKHYQKIIKQ